MGSGAPLLPWAPRGCVAPQRTVGEADGALPVVLPHLRRRTAAASAPRPCVML